MRKIAIIENSPGLGSYFKRFLDARGAEIRTYRCWPGQALLLRKFHVYIITGDFYNITEGLKDRHKRIVEMLERLKEEKVFGSCFGHQLIAWWRCGRIERRKERLLGYERIEIKDEHPALCGGSSFYALNTNQDEATSRAKGFSL